jgi:3-hydroxyacyl-CoA dehydrogenase/enoyl-CoA hydratase/3-hydroxybutyryl-CoA epimerase
MLEYFNDSHKPTLPRSDRISLLIAFSPVEKMQLVEVIVGKETSEENIIDYVTAIGKVHYCK